MKNQIEKFKDWFVWKFQNPYKLEMPYGYCPVQIEGKLHNQIQVYYFRARGCHWTFELADSEPDLLTDRVRFRYKEKYGETFEAGGMTKREAIKFATRALDVFFYHGEFIQYKTNVIIPKNHIISN